MKKYKDTQQGTVLVKNQLTCCDKQQVWIILSKTRDHLIFRRCTENKTNKNNQIRVQ